MQKIISRCANIKSWSCRGATAPRAQENCSKDPQFSVQKIPRIRRNFLASKTRAPATNHALQDVVAHRVFDNTFSRLTQCF